MREGTTQQVIDILAAQGITTALCARLDFKSETLCVWTGVDAIDPTGSGDSLLDGCHFDPLAGGIVLNVGDDAYSYTGSDPLDITLAIPSAPEIVIAAAQTFPDEYLARPVTIWRALLIRPSDPLAQPLWLFRRVRSGAMDRLEVSNDGLTHTFKLTIESHASLISSSSQATYLDQKDRYDSTDTSQDYAVSIANGGDVPKSSGGSTPSLASDARAALSGTTIGRLFN